MYAVWCWYIHQNKTFFYVPPPLSLECVWYHHQLKNTAVIHHYEGVGLLTFIDAIGIIELMGEVGYAPAAGSSMPSYAQKPNKWKYWVCGCSVGPSSHLPQHITCLYLYYKSIHNHHYWLSQPYYITFSRRPKILCPTIVVYSHKWNFYLGMVHLKFWHEPQHASQITRTENTRSLEHQISNFAST